MTYFKFSIPTILVSFFLMTSFFANGQSNPIKSPAEFFPKKGERPDVLLVGTFHFGYPGQDAHKTAEDKKVDILSEQKQKEVEELSSLV